MNKSIMITILWTTFGTLFGSIIGIYGTYTYLTNSQNYHKVYVTDSGEFILKGSKIYDIQELVVGFSGGKK